jgi:hypothetical protein
LITGPGPSVARGIFVVSVSLYNAETGRKPTGRENFLQPQAGPKYGKDKYSGTLLLRPVQKRIRRWRRCRPPRWSRKPTLWLAGSEHGSWRDPAHFFVVSARVIQSEIVELRFFCGLTLKETADILKAWEETIRRDWNVTKSRLKRELSRGQSRGI